MNHINLDIQPDSVRNFLMTLSFDGAETALEANGHVIGYVVPKPTKNRQADEPWTDAKNNRRCDLIDKKYRGEQLTPDEVLELNELQDLVSRHVLRVAPRPLDEARKLHQELLMKASKNCNP